MIRGVKVISGVVDVIGGVVDVIGGMNVISRVDVIG